MIFVLKKKKLTLNAFCYGCIVIVIIINYVTDWNNEEEMNLEPRRRENL